MRGLVSPAAKRAVFLVFGVILSFFVGKTARGTRFGHEVFWQLGLVSPPTVSIDRDRQIDVAAHGYEPVLGSTEARVVVVAFVDFSSRGSIGAMGELLGAVADDSSVRVLVKHHVGPGATNGEATARLAYALSQQGGLWENYASLDQAVVGESGSVSLPQGGSIDFEKLDADRLSKRSIDIVDLDYDHGLEAGVLSSPSFFVNGRHVKQPLHEDEWRTVVKDAKYWTSAQGNLELQEATVGSREDPANHLLWQSLEPGRSARGSGDVPITTFGDFYCPFYRRMARNFDRLHERHKKGISVIFRHLPAPHRPESELAARASIAASEQGRFWDYHQVLLGHKPAEREEMTQWAKSLGMDGERFVQDMFGERADLILKQDLEAAERLGLPGTPVTFVGGERLTGYRTLNDLSSAVMRVAAGIESPP